MRKYFDVLETRILTENWRFKYKGNRTLCWVSINYTCLDSVNKLNVCVWGRGSREAPYCPSQFLVEVLCDLSGTTSGSVWLVLWFPCHRPRLTSIQRPTLLQMPTSPRNYWTLFSSHVTTSSFEKEPMRVRQPEDGPRGVLTAPSLSGVWPRFPRWKEGWVLLIRPTIGSSSVCGLRASTGSQISSHG